MAFPAVTLADSLLRAAEENPLSKGHGGTGAAGEWVAVKSQATSTGVCAGSNGGWHSNETEARLAGWHPQKFTVPAIRMTLATTQAGVNHEVYFMLCSVALSEAKTNGYIVKLVVTGVGEYTLYIYKYVEGTPTKLLEKAKVTVASGEAVGVYIEGGKIFVYQWTKAELEKGEAGKEITSVADSTYPEGYLAFGAYGETARIKNVEVTKVVASLGVNATALADSATVNLHSAGNGAMTSGALRETA